MKRNYLYSDLQNHLFVPIFFETIDLYLRYRVITPNDFVVYQTMMRFLCRDKSNKHYGFTYITNSGINAITGVSAPTVAKSIKTLDKVGLIEIHDNPHKQGKFQKFRYTVYEPLPKSEFFKEFNVNEEKVEEIDETDYNQSNELPQDNLPAPESVPVAEDEKVKEDKPKAKSKARKPKKQFHEKEVETWNYNDFIAYFCYKFKEAYGTEYRIGSGNFAKENARLKKCCETYFNSDKIAFMFYIEEMFKKRAQFESIKFPTISLGTVCTFMNSFKLEKFFKMSKLHQNKSTDDEIIQQDDEKIDNNANSMIEYKKGEEIDTTYMNEEKKQAFNELKSLFN